VTGPGSASEPFSERYPHRFGASPPLSIGVEEELLLVDEELRLVAASEAMLETISGPLAERVSSEIFTEQIELKTGVCHGAGEVLRDLREARRAVLEAGFGLLGAGLHPDAHSGDVRLVAKPRYEIVRRDFGSLLRTPPCGLHVHVGMPDPETAVRIANAFRLYLPALQALSANSPFEEGSDSGHASARTSVVRSYPRFQVPREFRDYEDFGRVADQLIAAAGVDDYTYIWWDVRPHPQLGTVEVRALDVQTDVAASTSIAALIQAIAAKELDQPSAPALSREALEESYFQAASHGLNAEILLDGETPEPARTVIRRMLDSVRPYAGELGEAAALERVEKILREGNGAEDQRRVHSQAGMEGLLAYLAQSTGSGVVASTPQR
jgi:carboxylate-amine ligase